MSYATTPITPAPPVRKKSQLKVAIITIVRVIIVLVGTIAALPMGSHLWTWAHCGNAPVQMSLENYINKGADSDWVTLTGAYVDSDNRVDTQWLKNGQSTGVKGLSYYPLRTGPEDKHPVKVFLDATNFMVTTPQILLTEGNGPPKEFDKGYGLNDRQTVRGIRLGWFDFPSDLKEVLHSCKLGTTDEIILLKQGGQPISTSEAEGMIGFLAAVPILFGLTFIGRRKRAA
jgi:hypothetical protein